MDGNYGTAHRARTVKTPASIPSCGDVYVDGILALLQTVKGARQKDSALRMLRLHVEEMVESVKRGEIAQALLNDAASGADVLTLARQEAVARLCEEQKAERIARVEKARANREATARSFQLDEADALRLADAIADRGICAPNDNALLHEIQRALVEAQSRGEASAAEEVEKLNKQIEELSGEDIGTLEALDAGAQCAGAVLSIIGIAARDGEPRPCAEIRMIAEDALRANGDAFGRPIYFWGPVDEWSERWRRG